MNANKCHGSSSAPGGSLQCCTSLQPAAPDCPCDSRSWPPLHPSRVTRRLKSLLRCSCCAAPAAAAVLCRCTAPAVWRAAGNRHVISSYAAAGCATAKAGCASAELTSSCTCQGSAAQGQTAARDPGKTRASATACKWGGRRRGGEARRCMQRARQRPHPRSLPHRSTQQAHIGCACLAS